MIVDRLHTTAATELTCGGCRCAIKIDDAYGEVRVDGMRRPLIRCATCTQKMREEAAAAAAERRAARVVVPFPMAASG